MSLRIYDELIQGEQDWLAARCGLITASVIGQLLTPTLKVADNDTSRGITATLAAERITGRVEPVFVNADMWRGVIDEPYARAAYAEHHHAPVTEVGFMVRDGIGYSPDGLVGDDGLIEIKSRKPKKHLQTILADRVPAENMAQCQAGLLVSGRAWLDYVSFCGGLPLWVKRVEPDSEWFAALTAAAETFEQNVTAYIDDYRAAVVGLPLTERTPDLDRMVI